MQTKILAIPILLILLVTTASATTFYVDPEKGSMDNDGSSGSPWSTLQDVFEAEKIQRRTNPTGSITNPTAPVAPGDTIKLRTGYHGVIEGYDGWYNNEGPITIEADTGHSPQLGYIHIKSFSNWVFRGLEIRAELANTYSIILVNVQSSGNGDSSHITIEDNTISMASDATVSSWSSSEWSNKTGAGVMLNKYCHNCTVRNNAISNVSRGVIGKGDNMLVEYNTINKFTEDALNPDQGDDQTWQYNTVRNSLKVNSNHDDGMQVYISGGDKSGLVVRGNEIHCYADLSVSPFASGCQGFFFGDSGKKIDWIIEDNLLIVDHWHGITITAPTNTSILNNTVVHPPNGTHGPAIRIYSPDKASDLLIKNNIVWGGITVAQPANNFIVEGNLKNVSSMPYAVFEDYDNYDFRPKMDGPACPGGVPIGAQDCAGPQCNIKSECDDTFQCKTLVDCIDQQCVYQDKTGTCDDKDACTLNDTCSGGICSGTQKNCDDPFPCTTDSCSGGNCQNTPNNNACGTSTTCTTYTCSTIAGCQTTHNTGATCNDGIACTQGDSCNSSGNCQGTTDDDQCPNITGCTNKTCTTTGCIYIPAGCAIPPDLVLHMPFEGNMQDSSGNNNHGTCTSCPTLTEDRQGNANSAYSFDGASDFIDVADNASLDITDEITLAAWINPATAGQSGASRVISKRNTSGGSDTYALGLYSNVENPFIRLITSTGRIDLVANGIAPTGQWTHIAATYDGSNAKIYLNGIEDKSAAKTGNIETSTINLHIGDRTDEAGGRRFNGIADEIRIYNRALTSQEILTLYNEAGQECIDTATLLGYISSWKQGNLGMLSLMQKLEQWKAGTGCS